MTSETLITFAVVSTLILAAPGPIVLYAIYCALNHGKNIAWYVLPGVLAGDSLAMVLSLLGVGAILSSSPMAFMLLKLVGASYLIWMGVVAVMSPNTTDIDVVPARQAPFQMTSTAFALAFFHPGGFVFYAAFVPQFLDPSSPSSPQLIVLTAIFLAIAIATLLTWIIFADALHQRAESQSMIQRMKKIAGSIMAAVGVASVIVTLGILTW